MAVQYILFTVQLYCVCSEGMQNMEVKYSLCTV